MSNNPRSLEQFRSFWSNRANYGNITFDPDLLCNGNPIPVRDVDDAATTGSNSWRWLLGIDPAYIVENSKRLEEIWDSSSAHSPFITDTIVTKVISKSRLLQCADLIEEIGNGSNEYLQFVDGAIFSQFEDNQYVPMFSGTSPQWQKVDQFISDSIVQPIISRPDKILYAKDIRSLCYWLSKMKYACCTSDIHGSSRPSNGVLLHAGPSKYKSHWYSNVTHETGYYVYDYEEGLSTSCRVENNIPSSVYTSRFETCGPISYRVEAGLANRINKIEALVYLFFGFMSTESYPQWDHEIEIHVKVSLTKNADGLYEMPSWVQDSEQIKSRFYSLAKSMAGVSSVYACSMIAQFYDFCISFDLDCDLDGIGWSYTPG